MDLLRSFWIFLLLLLSLLRNATTQFMYYNDTDTDTDTPDPATEVLTSLLAYHDNRVRPNASGNATIINCRVKIISMDSITEVTMDYKVTIILEQSWHDKRLAFRHLSNLSYVQTRHIDIWLPDTVFSNEKNAYMHKVTVPNSIVRIWNNGSIWYSMKITLVLSCAMDFAKFPMDRQKCTTVIESYRSTASELRLEWMSPDPVQVLKQINLPQYNFDGNFTYGYCTDQNGLFEGQFACLEFSFILDRELAFYIVQTFLPSSLLVLMSWVSFWIDITQAPARVSLGVTIILTMTTTTTGFGSAAGLPKVSYTKAIDVWFDMCLGFVTMSLLEYALVHYLWNREMELRHLRMASMKRKPKFGIWRKSGPRTEDTDVESVEMNDLETTLQSRYNYSTDYNPIDDDTEGFVRYDNGNSSPRKRRADPEPGIQEYYEPSYGSRVKLIALNIDRVSRFLFPVTFIIACLTYWIVYNYIVRDHFEALDPIVEVSQP